MVTLGDDVAVHLLEEARQTAAAQLLDAVALLDQVAGHETVAMAAQHREELLAGVGEQRLGLLKRLLHPGLGGRLDPIELREEIGVLRVAGSRRLPQLAHLRRVDDLQVVVLAELHRLVEERADGEIEEGFAVFGRRRLLVTAKQLVAALLQAEEDARLAVTHQGLQVFEAQLLASSLRVDHLADNL